jgi:hypothetical protein
MTITAIFKILCLIENFVTDFQTIQKFKIIHVFGPGYE